MYISIAIKISMDLVSEAHTLHQGNLRTFLKTYILNSIKELRSHKFKLGSCN